MGLQRRIAELHHYVGFGAEDARALAAVRDLLAPDFPRIAREFYDKTREYEDAHAVFTGEEQIERLQFSLGEWLRRLFGGVYDVEYYERIDRIGDVHVRVGLPQRFMFAAMGWLRIELVRLIEARTPAATAEGTRFALNKALDIELAVMLESYRNADRVRLDRQEAITQTEGIDVAQAYFAATELTHELVVGIDAHGIIRLFNAGAEVTSGWRRDEMVGKPLVTLLADESHERIERLLGDRAPTRSRVDTLLRARTGRFREVRWDVAIMPVGEVHAFLIGHDYTDENALAERSRRSEKLAAVGTLAAGLAHEIRNPLNGAQLHVAYLERTLKRAGAGADALEAVGVVAEEIKRLASLVTEFLDFARPKPLEKKTSSLASLIERAAALAEPQAQAAGVEVVRDLPSRDIVADVDPQKLEQVLLNLARNAIEALAAAHGGRVTLRLRRRPKSAVVEVEDDGPGIPAPNAPIFDAFYTTKPEGTGLGLAITHRIVSDHDGTIEVDSRPGRTVFRVALPLSPSAEGNVP